MKQPTNDEVHKHLQDAHKTLAGHRKLRPGKLLITLIILLLATPAQGDIFNQLTKSTYTITIKQIAKIKGNSYKKTSNARGLAFSPHHIITAKHITDRKNDIAIINHEIKTIDSIEWTQILIGTNQAKIIWEGEEDLLILKVENKLKNYLKMEIELPEPGTSTLTATQDGIKLGIIGNYKSKNTMQLHTPTRPGDSGSPVIDQITYKLLGIITKGPFTESEITILKEAIPWIKKYTLVTPVVSKTK